MDNSFEQCVRKPDYTQDEKMFKLYTVLMVLSACAVIVGVIALLLGSYAFGALLAIMWTAVMFCFYKLRDKAVIEYDYEFVDSVITISRISHSSKRKTIITIPIEQLKSIRPMNANSGDLLKKNIYIDGAYYSVVNCSLNADSRLYILQGTSNQKQVMVIWEPKQNMLQLIKSERAEVVTL